MHGNEILTVGQLLDSDGLGGPRLVVLSACETGLYEIDRNPDEFVGLPGTFTALGAVGVLATLWPVSDAATALLIAKFYELHMGQGVAPATALHRAQVWLRSATNQDLQAYTKVAVAERRLEARQLVEIEEELSFDGLRRSKNRAIVEWIPGKTKPTVGQPTPEMARPYAHPYFWAGFVHTGL